MRPSEEAPSDFQDYTLVAVVAVATYLGQYPMGEQHGVPTLARKFEQDPNALEQVFEYIIASVNNYRETYMRMQALQEEGALDDDESMEKLADGRRRAHPTGGLMAAMSDLDGFAAKLNAILQADLQVAALAAGPLDVPPITISGAIDPSSANEVDSLTSKLRNVQEQVALLDRIQNIRVKNIQDEYQRFMERVRAKAQSAIDHANTTYSQQRNVLLSRFDSLATYITKHHHQVQPQQPALTRPISPAADEHGDKKEHDLGPSNASVNPMNMLSHSMASQLLALQANMAAAAAAAAGKVNPTNALQQNNLAAVFAQQQFRFPNIFSQMSESDMKAQMEQLENMAKGAAASGAEQQMAMMQAAMAHATQTQNLNQAATMQQSSPGSGTAKSTPDVLEHAAYPSGQPEIQVCICQDACCCCFEVQWLT